jgi:transcriptional regulator PpsR
MDFHPGTANHALNALADVTLKLDTDGVVVESQVNRADAADLRQINWQGKALQSLVIASHQVKVAQMIDWCVKHPDATTTATLAHFVSSTDTPAAVRYIFFYSSADQRIIAAGQDKRELSDAKQQLVNAQLSMERDYWSMRQTETRYRRLLDMSNDGFLVVDDSSQRVLECNQAASALLQLAEQSLVGLPFPQQGEGNYRAELDKLISTARTKGTASNIVNSPTSKGELVVDIDYLTQTAGAVLLVRISPVSESTGLGHDRDHFERVPDAVLQLDKSGRITATNRVFLDWIQEPSDRHVVGRNADDWLGRTGVDLQVLMSNLTQRGAVTRYASTLRMQPNALTDIEISASSHKQNDENVYLLFLRDTSRRISREDITSTALPASIEQITRRVGQTQLKELVRESTDVIEALCIESALKLTSNNRASAAELLGLSRQSLYTKLRRFGIGDSGDE